jgi:hypothetical protein
VSGFLEAPGSDEAKTTLGLGLEARAGSTPDRVLVSPLPPTRERAANPTGGLAENAAAIAERRTARAM